MDICEFTSPSIGRKNYLLVMIDEYSKFMVVFSIVNKSDATQEIIGFVTRAESCFELRIATPHSDIEFKSNAPKEFCVIRGIRQEFTTAETPLQNGRVERANRTLAEGIWAMLLNSGMADGYWGEAAKTFTYVSNLTPRRKLKYLTPWEVFTKKTKPAFPKFYFGEKVLFWLDGKKRKGKLDMPCGKRPY